MDHKQAIHLLIEDLKFELLAFITERESLFRDRWVPAAQIKTSLSVWNHREDVGRRWAR